MVEDFPEIIDNEPKKSNEQIYREAMETFTDYFQKVKRESELSPIPYAPISAEDFNPTHKFIPQIEFVTGKTLEELAEKLNNKFVEAETQINYISEYRFVENVGFVQPIQFMKKIPIESETGN